MSSLLNTNYDTKNQILTLDMSELSKTLNIQSTPEQIVFKNIKSLLKDTTSGVVAAPPVQEAVSGVVAAPVQGAVLGASPASVKELKIENQTITNEHIQSIKNNKDLEKISFSNSNFSNIINATSTSRLLEITTITHPNLNEISFENTNYFNLKLYDRIKISKNLALLNVSSNQFVATTTTHPFGTSLRGLKIDLIDFKKCNLGSSLNNTADSLIISASIRLLTSLANIAKKINISNNNIIFISPKQNIFGDLIYNISNFSSELDISNNTIDPYT